MGKRKERAKKLFSDKVFEETKHYSKQYAATVISIICIVICVLAVIGAWLLRDNFSKENLSKMREFVANNWFAGSLVFIGVCLLQVVIAFIPGEAIEIAAGVIFGYFWGTVLCMIGITLGSVIVIVLVRKFGRKFVESLYPREKIDSLPVLNDPKKRNIMVFILFFIPGSPKDLMTYIVGLTEMSIPMYILLTTVARIPSVLTSTLGGNAVGEGNIWLAVLIFAITTAVSGIGCIIYSAIKKKTRSKKKSNDKEEK